MSLMLGIFMKVCGVMATIMFVVYAMQELKFRRRRR